VNVVRLGWCVDVLVPGNPMYVCVCFCVCTCMYVYVCVCDRCTYLFIYICMYVHII